MTNVDSLSTNINLLSTTLTDINSHLATCKEKVEQCDTDHSNACTDQGLQPENFDASFDPAVVSNSKYFKKIITYNIYKIASQTEIN